MVEDVPPFRGPRLVRIEPDDRLVVVARTLQARDPGAEAALAECTVDWTRFGETCLGQALYRHRSVFRDAVDAPVWSHLELSYFRGVVPGEAVRDLAFQPRPAGAELLRAEVLLTSPASFILPRNWNGSNGRPVSLEYIDVRAVHLGEYRNIMRRYCGPAAARLVGTNRFGTFRAMETAAVLYRDPGFMVDWNQIHLCEVDADGFDGFSREFTAALKGSLEGADIASVFAGLDRIRSVPRWSFNDVVIEADLALGRQGMVEA